MYPGNVDDFSAFWAHYAPEVGVSSAGPPDPRLSDPASLADDDSDASFDAAAPTTNATGSAAASDDGGGDDDDPHARGECAYATARVGGHLDVRAVQNDLARSWPGLGYADYAAYADAVHARWTGEGVGWDHLLDNHLGLLWPHAALDTLVAPLSASATPFRAHVSDGPDEPAGSGSVWSAGVGGEGIEFHGTFDFTAFPSNMPGMDYCGSPSVPGARERTARDRCAEDNDSDNKAGCSSSATATASSSLALSPPTAAAVAAAEAKRSRATATAAAMREAKARLQQED